MKTVTQIERPGIGEAIVVTEAYFKMSNLEVNFDLSKASYSGASIILEDRYGQKYVITKIGKRYHYVGILVDTIITGII
jgi:hypothetical protein